MAFGGASLSVTVIAVPLTFCVPALFSRADSFSSCALLLPSSRSASDSTSRRSEALESSSPLFFRLRSWMRSESFSKDVSVRILVPLAVLKLVKKMSPARAKTATVSTRTGRKRRPGAALDPAWGESAELLNVPLSPSAPRKHYANGRPGEH